MKILRDLSYDVFTYEPSVIDGHGPPKGNSCTTVLKLGRNEKGFQRTQFVGRRLGAHPVIYKL
jgi:hypothetical protein